MKIILINLILVTSAFGQSPKLSDQESLRTVHAFLARAIDSGNLDAIASRVHPEAIGFFRDAHESIVLGPKMGIKEIMPALLENLKGMVSVSYDTDYRVFGDTAIVCDRFVLQRGGRHNRSSAPTRTTYVYARSEGQWLLVSWHSSAVPLR